MGSNTELNLTSSKDKSARLRFRLLQRLMILRRRLSPQIPGADSLENFVRGTGPASGIRMMQLQGEKNMSELIVAGFKGQLTADRVLIDLLGMEQIHLIDLDDAAVAIRKKDGTISIKQSSVLFVLVRKGVPDKVVEGLSKFEGTLLRSSLSAETEEELRRILQQSVTLKKEYHDSND
jgi:hypothetical protein